MTPQSLKAVLQICVGYFQWSGLQHALPPNVHMLTLEQWQGNTYLVRLEHIYEKNEDSSLSKPVNMTMKVRYEHWEPCHQSITVTGTLIPLLPVTWVDYSHPFRGDHHVHKYVASMVTTLSVWWIWLCRLRPMCSKIINWVKIYRWYKCGVFLSVRNLFVEENLSCRLLWKTDNQWM